MQTTGKPTRIPCVDVSCRHVLVFAFFLALGCKTRLGQQEGENQREDHRLAGRSEKSSGGDVNRWKSGSIGRDWAMHSLQLKKANESVKNDPAAVSSELSKHTL
jgi:hypothetical protein